MPDTPELPPTDLPPLLPCPFCGGAARIDREYDPDGFGIFYAGKCTKCGARSRQKYASNGNDCPQFYAEVRDEWNTRATRLAAAPQGWKPTPENINALPEPIRQYVMELETLCDPAGIVRENMLLKDCNRGLQLMYRKAADAAPAASSPEAADERAAVAAGQQEVQKMVRRWCRMIEEAYQCRDDIRDSAGMSPRAYELRFVWDEILAVLSAPAQAVPQSALASAPAGAGEGEQHAPVSPELDATMLWLGETRDSLRAMADRANQLLTAHCRAALAGEPAVAADEGREDTKRLDWLDDLNATLNRRYGTNYGWKLVLSPNVVRLMSERPPTSSGHVADIDLHDSQARGAASCRDAIDAARAASQDEQQEKQG